MKRLGYSFEGWKALLLDLLKSVTMGLLVLVVIGVILRLGHLFKNSNKKLNKEVPYVSFV
jgi:hypothetical protein